MPNCELSSIRPTASTSSARSSSGTACASSSRSSRGARERGGPLRVITTTYMGATDQRALDRLVASSAPRSRSSTRRSDHPAPRQGVAVPPRHGIRHRVRRVVQPVAGRAARRRGVERPALATSTPRTLMTVRRDVRELLERPDVRDVRPGPGRATGWTTPSARQRREASTARPSRSPAWRCGRTRTRRRCSTTSRRSGRCTTGTATWSSRRPAPARRSSRRWTTGGLCESQDGRPLCSSWRTARRSWSSRCATYREVLAERHFGELYVGGQPPERWRHVFASVQSLTATASRAFRPTPTTWWSSTSSTTRRRRPTAASWSTCSRRSCSASPRHPSGPTAPTSGASSTAAPPPNCGSGMRSSEDLLCPFHYFGVARRHGSVGHRVEARRVTTLRGSPTSTPATTRARAIVLQAAAGTKSPMWAPCGLWDSASQSRTPSTWLGHSRQRASRRLSVTGETRPRRPRPGPR